MASWCFRSAAIRSFLKAKPSARAPLRQSPSRRTPSAFSTRSALPAELGCCSGSMFPLYSAVAAARLTSRLSSSSRSCRALSQGT